MFRGHSSSLWCYLNTFRITAKCHHDVLFDVRLMLQFCIIDISRIFICKYPKKSFFVIYYEQSLMWVLRLQTSPVLIYESFSFYLVFFCYLFWLRTQTFFIWILLIRDFSFEFSTELSIFVIVLFTVGIARCLSILH